MGLGCPYRPNGAAAFIEKLLHTRYRGLSASLFPTAFGNITATEKVEIKPQHCQSAARKPSNQQAAGGSRAEGECDYRIGTGALIEASQICSNPAHPGTIPIKAEIAQELQFQADTATNVLINLPNPAVRDLLLGDYVEELTAEAIGVERTYAFLRHCFAQQTYYVTKCDESGCDPEYWMWEYFS